MSYVSFEFEVNYYFLFPECPRKVRVGANSPSLCPTMFSVTNTGTNVLPLCTAIVCPTMSGTIIEARDQVLITDLRFDEFALSIFAISLWNTYGPFLIDLAMTIEALKI